MKKTLITALLLCSGLSNVMAGALNGTTWIAKDDKTDKPRAEVLFEEQKGKIDGHVVAVYPEPGDTGICSNCPGELKDEPIKDINIIWGMKKEGDGNYSGGEILDPRTGRVYRVKMMLKGDKLYVRGYLGVSLIGRTQVWERKKT